MGHARITFNDNIFVETVGKKLYEIDGNESS